MNRARPGMVLLVFFAGCLAAPTPATDPDGLLSIDYDAIEATIGEPVDPDHDHADASVHKGSYDLERLALANGHGSAPAPPGEFFTETAVRGDYAYLCRLGPEAGLVIFDIQDIAHPKPVGYLHLEAGFEPDIEVSDDGKWAFWETQRFPTSAETPSAQPQANLPRGVHIIDVSEKTNPRWAGFSPTTPDGPHSITYAQIGGRHILLQSVYAMAYAYAGVEVPGQQRLIISELDTSGPVATLRTLAEYIEPGATGKGGLFPHDVTVQEHPLTHRTLAYVAYWNVGVLILDVSDPAKPERVSAATDFGPAPYRSVHMARAFPDLIDGRHVTVVEPEIGAQPDSGYMTFLDTTDPAKPTYLSSWRLPGNLTSLAGLIGPHYFDAQEGRVALASYHAGFWVIDVHDRANLFHPRTVAYALVDLPRGPLAPHTLFGAEPSAFDAWWVGDHVLGGDVYGGLAVYRYSGPAPPPV